VHDRCDSRGPIGARRTTFRTGDTDTRVSRIGERTLDIRKRSSSRALRVDNRPHEWLTRSIAERDDTIGPPRVSLGPMLQSRREPIGVLSRDDEIRALYPSLRRLAGAVRPREVDADDLVQQALVNALAQRPLEEYSDLGAYLRTAILNLARNQHRTLSVRARAAARLERVVHHAPVYPSDLDELRRLPVMDRAVLYLSLVEHRAFAEIAELLGCSEQAARTRSSRATRRLRHALDAAEEESVHE